MCVFKKRQVTKCLSYVFIPQNIQKMLGFAPSRAASKVGGLLAPPQGAK